MAVNTNDTTHEIKVTPRFFPCTSIDIHIKDSYKGTDTVIECEYREHNNLLYLTFDYDFTDESNYQVKVLDTDLEIIFRGEVLSTTQDTQEYSSTSNRYKW